MNGELLDVFDSSDFRSEINFDRFDLTAASGEEFRIAKRLSVVRLQIVEDEGFVRLIEKLPNFDCLGVLAVGPATLQICGTIDVIIVRTGESKSLLKVDSRADRSFVSYALK